MAECRRFFVVFVLVLCACVFLPGTGRAQTEGIKILVLPFQVNASPDLEYLNESLPELLSDKLAAEGFQVVSRQDMLDLVDKNQVDFLDIKTARRLALLAGAKYAVYGSFSQAGEAISIDARLVEAFGLKESRPIFVSRDGIINILPAVEELATTIKRDLKKEDEIAEIDVEGTKALDKDVVLLRINLKKGDLYDPKAVNADLRRVYEIGYFDDVTVRTENVRNGKKIVFTVKEKPLIGAIRIIGADEIDEDDITETMTTKTGAVLNPDVLSDDLSRIRDLYRKEGYYKADIKWHMEGGENQMEAPLVIEINEGPELYITDISVDGAKSLDTDDIKDELALSERGMLSWIFGSGVLKEELLERDAAAIEAYYANRGFLNVKVGQPEVRYDDDGIKIIFRVEEGPRFKIGKVDFAGDLLESKEILAQRTKLDELAAEDEYLDRSIIRSDLESLSKFYSNYGYAFADTEVSLEPDLDEQRIHVTYKPVKNQKVFVRRVVLEGNTKTRGNVIRRELLLADGDMYSGAKLARSNERLRKLDFFQEVEMEPIPTGDPAELDLKVTVKEKPTGTASLGAGYSSFAKLFVTASIRERNLFGRGYQGTLSGTISGRGGNYVFGFMNPHLYDSKLAGGFDLYWNTTDYDQYTKETLGGKIKFGYPLGEYTNSYWGYKLEHYDVRDVENNAAQAIWDAEGKGITSALNAGIVRDTTNNPFLPTRGTINRADIEYAGGPIGGNDDYIRMEYESQYFRGLFWDTVFHVRGKIGYVAENFGDEPIEVFDLYRLGGINDVRGYDGLRISPIDPVTGDPIGGDKMFFLNLEYLFPLIRDMNIFGLAFFDAGNSWAQNQFYFEDTKQDDGSPLFLGLYKSVGAGIRWNSPLGILRLEYGYPLDKLHNSAENGKFEFSVGQAF